MAQQTVVAVIGSGPSTRKHTAALLDDWASGKNVVIAAAGGDAFGTAVRHAADWALSSKTKLMLCLPSKASQADYEDYAEAAEFYADPDPTTWLLNMADVVMLAWDEHDSAGSEWVAEQALKRGKAVLDLTDGLFPITADEPAEQRSPASEEAPAGVTTQEARNEAQETTADAGTASPGDEAQTEVEGRGPISDDLVERVADLVIARLALALKASR